MSGINLFSVSFKLFEVRMDPARTDKALKVAILEGNDIGFEVVPELCFY